MLRELRIVNLALIEELHISFPAGLVVLTGETGAGKSIILQAIHLLSGGKVAGDWIRTGAESATVEALFEIRTGHRELRQSLEEAGIEEADGELIVRRVLTPGKSRFFINGCLVTAKIAGDIAEHLLSVASQHDHQQLLAPRSHLDFIDAMGGHGLARRQLGAVYDEWQALRARLRQTQEAERDKEQRRDFLAFQAREIEEARLQPGEDELLAREKERLKSSDSLMRLGRESYHLLAEAVTEKLALARRNLEQMAALDQGVAGLAEEVAGHAFELEDRLAQLRDYVDNLADDPAALDRITARIDLLQRLKRKYGPELADVIACGEKARGELTELESMDELLAGLGKELEAAERTLLQQAGELSAGRLRTAERLAAEIGRGIESLSLPGARFEIGFEGPGEPGLADLGRTGWDRPQLMFSANPGEPVKPLAKVASGGELSRLMLALKCVLARQDQVETVIFDEIDAGISGKAAEAVARKIRELAGHHQVLCITHLPQIAACAEEHFLVEKSVAGARTRTTISRLPEEAKAAELARMLDGDSATGQTLAYARELLARNRTDPGADRE
ncbi:MAG: DNA repair protein RecN [Desulfobacteraceae bacterium]|nr:DNA repair protein RecN [Desulfobacteraceae bacterium]